MRHDVAEEEKVQSEASKLSQDVSDDAYGKGNQDEDVDSLEYDENQASPPNDLLPVGDDGCHEF